MESLPHVSSSSSSSSSHAHSSLLRMYAAEPPQPVRLHPLVVLNITHHLTRTQCRQQSSLVTLGILLGRQTGEGAVDIVTSYEVVFDESSSSPNQTGSSIDWPAVRHKRERLVEVVPELLVVGWYGVGATREAAARCGGLMQSALCDTFHDVSSGVLLALLLDPDPPAEWANLPVHLFEVTLVHEGPSPTAQEHCGGGHSDQSTHCNPSRNESASTGTDRVGSTKRANEEETASNRRGEAQRSGLSPMDSRIVSPILDRPHLLVVLSKWRFALESDEIEKVGLDAAMNSVHASHPSATSTTTAPQLRRTEQSLRLLRQRIVLVEAYLEALEKGHIAEMDHEVLRHVARVCAMLPSREGSAVTAAAALEVQQSQLVALLSLQTKCATTLSEVASAQRRLV